MRQAKTYQQQRDERKCHEISSEKKMKEILPEGWAFLGWRHDDEEEFRIGFWAGQGAGLEQVASKKLFLF